MKKLFIVLFTLGLAFSQDKYQALNLQFKPTVENLDTQRTKDIVSIVGIILLIVMYGAVIREESK